MSTIEMTVLSNSKLKQYEQPIPVSIFKYSAVDRHINAIRSRIPNCNIASLVLKYYISEEEFSLDDFNISILLCPSDKEHFIVSRINRLIFMLLHYGRQYYVVHEEPLIFEIETYQGRQYHFSNKFTFLETLYRNKPYNFNEIIPVVSHIFNSNFMHNPKYYDPGNRILSELLEILNPNAGLFIEESAIVIACFTFVHNLEMLDLLLKRKADPKKKFRRSNFNGQHGRFVSVIDFINENVKSSQNDDQGLYCTCRSWRIKRTCPEVIKMFDLLQKV